MNAKVVSKENNVVKFTFQVGPEKFEEGMKYAYEKNKKHISIPGFRQGKVPRKIIEANYGAEIFYDDALNFVLETEYPEGLECVPPRFAISYRNRWLIQQSDMVITYITRDWGGAAQFVRKAIRYGKTIVPLIADNQQQNGK